MRKLTAIVAIMALCALPNLVWAADAGSTEEKDIIEVNFFGGLSQPMSAVKNWQDSIGAKTGFNYGFHVGYFATSNFVVGAAFTFSQYGIDSQAAGLSTQHHRLYSPAMYLKYNFVGTSNFIPFIEGNMGADFVKFATIVNDEQKSKYRELGYKPAFAMGLSAGLFYYTSDYSGFFIQAGYHHGFTKDAWKEYQGTRYVFGKAIDQITISVGLQAVFGG